MSEGDRSPKELAREYLDAVDRRDRAVEDALYRWHEEYREPGYLSGEEWDILKESLEGGDMDGVETVVKLAIYRKAATEDGRADEFEDDWPAKRGSRGDRGRDQGGQE